MAGREEVVAARSAFSTGKRETKGDPKVCASAKGPGRHEGGHSHKQEVEWGSENGMGGSVRCARGMWGRQYHSFWQGRDCCRVHAEGSDMQKGRQERGGKQKTNRQAPGQNTCRRLDV